MAQEEKAIRGKEDDETDNPSSPPPKLNLRRLESIQHLLQYASVLVLFVFIILIALSYYNLRGLDQEIKKANTDLINKNAEITNRQTLIDNQEEKIAKNEETIKGQEVVIGKYIEKSSLKTNNEVLENTPINLIKGVLEKSPDTAKSIPARIFIQIRKESQRIAAANLQKILQSQGYIVPRIENVKGEARQNSYLTYCRGKGDSIKAQDITNLVSNVTGIKIPSPAPNSAGGCDKGSFGVYELWLEADFESSKKEIKQPINPKEVLVPKIDSRKLSNKKP